jgi:predicted nucleic acid-binding protein
MTPEGLNSRLTFLNQCMRQGPSIYDRKTDKNGQEVGIQPQNLSFGRPPICILRIGDFFHTKIAINSLSISYEGGSGIQYDLNPEGIGVQPMIANVQLSIDYIGGNTLAGPINRLQNAVSFNYYANTEIYDVRSDSVVDGQLIEGLKLSQLKQQLVGNETLSEIYDGLQKSDTLNQVKENEETDDTDDDGVTDNSFLEMFINGNSQLIVKTTSGKKPSEIEFKEGKSGSTKEDSEMVVNITFDTKEKEEPGDVATFTYDLYQKNKSLASVTKLKELTDAIKTAMSGVTTAEQFFKANRNNQDARIDYLDSKTTLKQKEKDYKDYLDVSDVKFKVEAFLTEKKNKTRIQKTFTVTENGIN